MQTLTHERKWEKKFISLCFCSVLRKMSKKKNEIVSFECHFEVHGYLCKVNLIHRKNALLQPIKPEKNIIVRQPREVVFHLINVTARNERKNREKLLKFYSVFSSIRNIWKHESQLQFICEAPKTVTWFWPFMLATIIHRRTIVYLIRWLWNQQKKVTQKQFLFVIWHTFVWYCRLLKWTVR